MPKFKIGAPQVTFISKAGKKFTNTYHSRASALKSVKGWRKAGGKIDKIGAYGGISKLSRKGFRKYMKTNSYSKASLLSNMYQDSFSKY